MNDYLSKITNVKDEYDWRMRFQIPDIPSMLLVPQKVAMLQIKVKKQQMCMIST